MNIALEKTEEYVNGRLRRNYGDAFVRGNNGRSRWFTVSALLILVQLCTYPQAPDPAIFQQPYLETSFNGKPLLST